VRKDLATQLRDISERITKAYAQAAEFGAIVRRMKVDVR
jgi:hypothetical protein